jgi:glucose/mannose-6-phosphate isomerase
MKYNGDAPSIREEHYPNNSASQHSACFVENTGMDQSTDTSGMHKEIMAFPQQFSFGYAAAKDAGTQHAQQTFGRMVIAGIGGSALPGALLRTAAEAFPRPLSVVVHRDYGLPADIDLKRSFVVVVSYSGNTEEALSAYDAAREQKLALAVVTSGGELKERAERDSVAVAVVPGDLQPRNALGYQFAAILGLLANAGIIPSQKEALDSLGTELDPEREKARAEELTQHIAGTTLLFYASQKYRALAYILKIQMNENAKLLAFSNSFPELDHNEIVGYEASPLEQFSTVILAADDDLPRIKKRQEITAQLITERGGRVYTIDIQGNKIYNRIFNTVLLGMWLSYQLALQRGIDPAPVKIVEALKKKLAE